MTSDPLKYFRIEARELLQELGKAVLALEKGPVDHAVVAHPLRLAHTLKGAARVVKQPAIANLAHALEDLLAPLRSDPAAATRARVDAMLANLDATAAQLSSLPVAGSASPGGPSAAPSESGPELPVQGADAGDALEALVEASIESKGARTALGAAAELQKTCRMLSEQLAVELTPQGWGRSATAAQALRSTVHDLSAGVQRLTQAVGSGLDRVDRELALAQEAIEQLTLVPADAVFPVLERVVRDTSTRLGLKVDFRGRSSRVRLEVAVLAQVQAALIQLIRNSVVHGIESEGTRTAAGKSPAGQVAVEIERRSARVAFTCRDDGRGIDLEEVRKAAVGKGLIPGGDQPADRQTLVRLLLAGGLSTARAVTELSGRGVGLDLVRESVSRLGGEVSLRTDAGKGTSFELLVPVSVSSIQVLTVEASGVKASIPLDSVVSTFQVPAREVISSGSQDRVVHHGKTVPFLPLAKILGKPYRPPVRWSAALLQGNGATMALGVEAILATGRAVIRNLPDLAPALPVVGGAILDASGTVRLVLDAAELAMAAEAGVSRTAPESDRVTPPILIVDDSMTTRMLERSILESAGYDVELAASAEEGLEKARSKAYGLYLVDVEMPGMDGFSFVQMTRGNAEREVPAILVTSRNASEDKQRGIAVGASGYIVKSEFDQVQFLESVRRLLS